MLLEVCFQETCRKLHTNEYTAVKIAMHSFLPKMPAYLTEDQSHVEQAEEFVSCKMLGFSKQV